MLWDHCVADVLTADEEKQSKRNGIKDDLVKDYDAVIRESALLTTASGFLFGFLLNISINTPKGFSTIHSIVLMITLFSITLAVIDTTSISAYDFIYMEVMAWQTIPPLLF